MGAAAKVLNGEGARDGALSDEMMQFVDHVAELLAEEFVAALKEEGDAGSGVRAVLEREPTRAEHRGPGSGL